MRRPILVGLSITLFAHAIDAQSCYAPDGSKLPNIGFFSGIQPCTSGGPSTICCATNRTNSAGGNIANGDTKDECLPNGLCQNRVTKDGVESTKYFANFCTDSNWNGGNCLNICAQTRDDTGKTMVTSCNGRADSDRWCCGDSTACCGSGIGLVRLAQIFGGIVSSASSAPAASSTTRAISSSPSASSSTSPSPTPISDPLSVDSANKKKTKKKKSKLSGGAIAGIVIGVLAVLALLAVLLFFVLRANKQKKAAAQDQLQQDELQHRDGQVSEVDGNTAMPPQYNEGFVREKYGHVGEMEAGHGANNATGLAEMQQPPSELPAGNEATHYEAHPGGQQVIGTEAQGAPSNAPVR